MLWDDNPAAMKDRNAAKVCAYEADYCWAFVIAAALQAVLEFTGGMAPLKEAMAF